jgi:phospholipid/cholesterol/gamma-HCH transport system permease protein
MRELGPVLVCLMLAARVGSGIAAELGSMVVTEQVLAIEALGANPVHKLVLRACWRSRSRRPLGRP